MPDQIVYGFTGDCLHVNGNTVGCKFKVDSTTNVTQVRAKAFQLGTTAFGEVDQAWATLTNQGGTNCYSSSAISLAGVVTPGYERQKLDNYRFTMVVRVERMQFDPRHPENPPTLEFGPPVPADPIAIAGMPDGCNQLDRLTPNPQNRR